MAVFSCIKLIFLISMCMPASTENSRFNDFVASVLSEKTWSAAWCFTCGNPKDDVKWMKLLFSHGIPAMVYPVSKENFLLSQLTTSYYPVMAFVDISCDNVDHILNQASDHKMFNSLLHWVLFPGSNETSDMENNAIMTSLASLNIPLNSFVAVVEFGLEPELIIQLVYKIEKHQPLIVTSLDWSPGNLFKSIPTRDDYGGTVLTATALVVDGTWDEFLDIGKRHINTEAKMHYQLMVYVSETLNFRMNITITDTWGYPMNGSDCFNGIVGTLQENCGSSELSTSALMWKSERMDIMDYAGETIVFDGGFMFLKPSLSAVSIIYELPFSISVWITFVVAMSVMAIMLVYVQRAESHFCKASDEPVLWSDVVLNTIGIICQQGTGTTPTHIAARIVFIFLLLLSLFLVTSYSAIIVSLLQTTSNSINTLADLMNSPLKFSMVDLFANEVTDPTVEKVFKEKLYTQPFHEAFVSEAVGMEKIRRGLHTFHGLFGANKIISDTFEEHEKCRFKQINMFLANHVGFPIRKGSPYTEHIRRSNAWLREAGILNREKNRWYYQKPKCETGGQNFVSVGIQDFYPTLVILSYGILLSLVILVLEACHRRHRLQFHNGTDAEPVYEVKHKIFLPIPKKNIQ